MQNDFERENDKDGQIDLSKGLPVNGKSGKIRINQGVIVTVVLVAAIAVLAGLILKDYIGKKNSDPSSRIPTPAGNGSDGGAVIYDINKPYGEETSPTPAPLRPQSAGEGLLPVFYRANTTEKKIAVTVSGRVKEAEKDKLIEAAREVGARLTFFPTGEAVNENPEIWTSVNIMGHEIESSGLSGKRFLECDGESEMAHEIDGAIQALRDYISADYELHFIRTNDLYDDEYLPLHALLKARGVYGIARQSVQMDRTTRPEDISAGSIVNMQIGDMKVDDLCSRIKSLAEQGYKLVTLNELFEYPPNYVSTPETEW